VGSAREIGDRSVEAFNSHDQAAIRAMFADSVVFEAPGDVRLEGPDATAGYAMGWLNAFPDSKITVHNNIEAGDLVIHEFTFEGTHEQPLQGPAGEIPPTGRRLAGRGIEVLRVEGDKIIEDRLYFDQVQVMTQLGLMPGPASA